MLGFPHHIDLTVSDLETSVQFYEKVLSRLGFERDQQYGGGAPCWIYQSEQRLVFSLAIKAAQASTPHNRYAPGLHHLAFRASSRAEVDEIFGYLRCENIEILDPPSEYDYTPGYYAVFFADPDGIKLELVHEPRD